MTDNQKIEYLRIALQLQGIGCNNEMADRIITTYEAVTKLEGKFSVKHAVDIQYAMDRKYAKIKIEEDKP